MNRYLVLGIISVMMLLGGAAGFLATRQGAAAASPPGYLVQQGLYPVQLNYLQGAPAQPGKPTLLEFWQINCPGCLQSIAHLNELHGKYAARGLQIVGITPDSPERLQQFMQRTPITYPLASDPGDRYGRALHVYGLPDAALLDASGTIRWRGDPRALTEADVLKVLE